jgi:RNA polymerase sigma-70 factor, ECF subfamily
MSQPPNLGGGALESTRTLVRRAQQGDEAARSRLFDRCLPLLRKWARGRLPLHSRDLSDTDDLVQTTLINALSHLGAVRAEHSGSFLAYVRQVFLNAVRDEARRGRRRRDRDAGGSPELQEEVASPPRLGSVITPETVLDYERALEALPDLQRQAVILRIEFGLSYSEIALELEQPSANSVRMMVSRSLVRLAQELA